MEIKLSLVITILTATQLPLVAVSQLECRDEIASLSPCYGYIRGREEFPSPECCNGLEDVVQRQPDCLCEVLRGGEGVDTARLSELPSACSVPTPSLDNCYYDDTPPFFSGYSTEILSPLLISVLTVASCAQIIINPLNYLNMI